MIGSTAAMHLFVAGLIGLAVGFEREWSGHATGPSARFAGLRTFLLIGVFGGSAGLILEAAPIAAAAMIVTAGAFIIASYVAAVRRPGSDLDGTTESAALVVLALGLLSGMGFIALASGTTVVVVIALNAKSKLHALVHRVGGVELRAGLQFAVLALVILPLLPEGPFGPLGGVRPRTLWMVVLLFSALNFLGYIARRATGARRGYPIVGLIGGLVSSTAVTLQFARKSRDVPELSGSLALGAVAAWTMVLPRVMIVSAALNVPLALALVPYIAPAAAVSIVLGVIVFLRTPARSPEEVASDESESPLKVWTAVQMAVALQLVLMALVLIRSRLGSDAVLASAALLGLTNVDALTFAMSRLGTTPATLALAAKAIAVGLVATTVWKGLIGVAVGAPRFRPMIAVGAVVLAGAIAGGFLLAG